MHAMRREKEFRMTVIIEEKSYQIHLQSTFLVPRSTVGPWYTSKVRLGHPKVMWRAIHPTHKQISRFIQFPAKKNL